ncbi:LytTR family DNA-binding domain-containing protein [Pedobacter sp. Hv1]|uniref:LytR/AlgR family response regulator transcription factor n=1 Tax=Pedobacter sp. Hv1 TaxID=1740090 RepID=UPI0006D898B6|nr:LytTR family DNA-binding domain-containing protein [Pedobacter sp. Hv1]KQC02202.1 LytTR family transcriptional regulator [Pedobacter sp. Hv1]
MSLRCLIIDDEPLAHEVILEYSKDIPFLQICGQCYRATEAFEFLSSTEIDLIFLDIRMPKLSGLDFLRTLQRKPLIIITSAYEEYALESFDLAVCDYLLKPFRFDRFLKAVNRALENYDLKNKANHSTPTPANDGDQISIKADKKHILVKLNDLQYLESLGNYVKVWGDNEFLLTPRTLSSFEEQLPPDIFVRIHKSFILNKKYVHYLEGNMIFLKNGQQVPIGKNYKPIIKQLLDMEE